jgi:hypothetical protein
MASLNELVAASALIVTCEKIVAGGFLPEKDEQSLRVILIKACKAFEIAPLAERTLEPFPIVESGAY